MIPSQRVLLGLTRFVSKWSNIKLQMRGILDKFGKLTQKLTENHNSESTRAYCKSPLPTSSITATKSVQTEFPVAMLESYVVKNRKRILTLLNIPHDSVLSLCSMPSKPKKNDQFDHQKSWNTIPSELNSRLTQKSPKPEQKDSEKSLLLNGDCVKMSEDANVDQGPDYIMYHGGKRCSEGDIARQMCLTPLLSNGTSCNLVNERKMAITDFWNVLKKLKVCGCEYLF